MQTKLSICQRGQTHHTGHIQKSELETDAVRATAPYTVFLGLNAVE